MSIARIIGCSARVSQAGTRNHVLESKTGKPSKKQDGRYDANVGDDNADTRDNEYCSSQGKNHQVVDVGVRTRQLQDRSYVTEKVSYLI